jgi:hypothetical protein
MSQHSENTGNVRTSRRDVIRRIVRRDNQEQSLREEVVQREDAKLFESACQHFGTWGTALRYAGVDIDRLAKGPSYGPEAVIRQIRRLCHGTYNLTAKRVRHRDGRLYRAALEHFGTWKKALRAAGINPDHVRPHKKGHSLNRQQMVEAILDRKRRGQSLRCIDVRRENYAFAVAAKHRFGSWRAALIAAGVKDEGGG